MERIPAPGLRWPATRAAALAALVECGGYALLSGLSVPAQRSFLMLAVAMAALIFLRAAAPGRILALALLVVLVPIRSGGIAGWGSGCRSARWRRFSIASAGAGVSTGRSAEPDPLAVSEHHLGAVAAVAAVFQLIPAAFTTGQPDRHSSWQAGSVPLCRYRCWKARR
ncbi:MAG: ComEC/Rec2 family competence protein [Candidatus Competibacteraceae bacterium]|nr:ComEC/Rec2 family competence protein [Candidatus Competibacteraceae bacterium]